MNPARPIKIGLLHSLTGAWASSERPLLEAGLLAIEEINRRGGVLGCPIEGAVGDGASSPAVFAAKAQHLMETGVVALFGCGSAEARKAARKVVEPGEVLLWCLGWLEGFEESLQLVYVGPLPNQLVVPALDWVLAHGGIRSFLIGSERVYSRLALRLVRGLVESKGGGARVEGEFWVRPGERDYSAAIAAIRQAKPDVVFSALMGEENWGFFPQYQGARLNAKETPVVSLAASEVELAPVAATAAGHFVAAAGFQTLDLAENRRFVSAFRGRYGSERVCSAAMALAYSQIYLWKAAVEAAGTWATPAVRPQLGNVAYASPVGRLTLAPNRHVPLAAHIGRCTPTGELEVIWSSPILRAPLPWMGLEEQKSVSGLKVLLADHVEVVLERCGLLGLMPGPTSGAGSGEGVLPMAPTVPAEVPATLGTRPCGKQTSPPVDLERLRDVAGDDPERMRELIDVYLQQTDHEMAELGVAIEARRATDVARLAHKLVGASVTCGMEGLGEILRRIETEARAGIVEAAPEWFDAATEELEGVRRCLASFLQGLEKRPAAAAGGAVESPGTVASPGKAWAVLDGACLGASATLEESAVDLGRLQEIAEGDAERVRELANLYLEEATEALGGLARAVEGGDAALVARLAHKLAGASLTCGMNAMATVMRELEQAAAKRDLAAGGSWVRKAQECLGVVRGRLATVAG